MDSATVVLLLGHTWKRTVLLKHASLWVLLAAIGLGIILGLSIIRIIAEGY
jgi:hypothetical protein